MSSQKKHPNNIHPIIIRGKKQLDLSDLTPEQKAFIEQKLKKAEKYLKNPVLAGIIKNMTGIDIDKLSGQITSSKSENTTEEIIISENKSQGKPTEFTSQIPEQKLEPDIPKPVLPSSGNNPATQHFDGRTILGIAGFIGLIGWLLYEFTDII